MEPDPIGLEGGLNPYAYAGNNPVNNVDPSGLMYGMSDGDMGNFSLPSNLQFNMMNSIDTMNRFQQNQMNGSSYSPVGTGTVLAPKTSYSSSPNNLLAGTYSFSLGGNSTPVRGGGGQAGAFLTTGDSSSSLFKSVDAGLYGTASITTGFGAGAGVGFDYWQGGRSNFDGKAITDTICVAIICGGVHSDSSGKYAGWGVSIGGDSGGGVAPGGSFTHSSDYTKSLTIRDLINLISRK